MDHDDGFGPDNRSTGGDVLARVMARWRDDPTFAFELADNRDTALAPFGLTLGERARIDRLIDGDVTYGHLFGSPGAAAEGEAAAHDDQPSGL